MLAEPSTEEYSIICGDYPGSIETGLRVRSDGMKGLNGLNRLNTDVFTIEGPLDLELNHTIHRGKQGVIPPATHVITGMELGATLSYDDVAGLNELATKTFHSQSLGVGITSVA